MANSSMASSRAPSGSRANVEYDVPAVLVPKLERYVEHYRPILLSCGARYTPAVLDELWISREGLSAHRRYHAAIADLRASRHDDD
jgi:hypothetical protein